MKVKIVKCTPTNFWYSTKIGNVYDVRPCNSLGGYEEIYKSYSCLDFYKEERTGNLILKSDIEEVKDYDFVKPSHYKLWEGMQEFELHRKLLSKDEYIGFLKGNIIKYQMRLGRKPTEPVERDQEKIKVYSDELERFLKG